MDIVIIHYNTQKLTDALLKSIELHVSNPVVYIFDNSDKTPFINSYDFVNIIDNTKGQIINFDQWLSNFPNKDNGVKKVNNYGSAKHCISIETCMNILKKPFVLLDSDVLIKKDFSDICDNTCIFVGEPAFTGGPKQRILPYICYINTPMCIENNIHYFSEKRMHGLNAGNIGNMYDTGASFCEDTKKYSHRTISCDDYIAHLKAGSWKDTRKTSVRLSEDEWLNKYSSLWNKPSDSKKKVIYTCITNGYDTLKNPKVLSKGFDYVCFTDNTSLKSNVWQIRLMPKETNTVPSNKKQRYVKINPHIVLPEYETSIWVDGNLEMKSDLNELLGEESIIIPKHPVRDCIYDEMDACAKLRKDIGAIMHPQIKRYQAEGFPKHYGLVQSNIIIRKHNTEECKRIMNLWWKELSKGSHRDQLSFNYCLWKNQDVKIKLLDKDIFRSKWFGLTKHTAQKKYVFNLLKQKRVTPKITSIVKEETDPIKKVVVKKKVIKKRMLF